MPDSVVVSLRLPAELASRLEALAESRGHEDVPGGEGD